MIKSIIKVNLEIIWLILLIHSQRQSIMSISTNGSCASLTTPNMEISTNHELIDDIIQCTV